MNIRMVVPVQVGVVALLAGGFFAYLTLQDSPDENPAASPRDENTRVVSREGGFSLTVPDGLTASKRGETVKLTSKDRSLVVTAGPTGTGSLTKNSRRFVKSLADGYTGVRVLGYQPQKVDGRSAVATFGQAVNTNKVKVRFVSVVISAKPRDYAITTFTGFGTDPDATIPMVNAIVGTFEVLPAP